MCFFLFALCPVISTHSCNCQSDKSLCFPTVYIPCLHNAYGIANQESKKIITKEKLFTPVSWGQHKIMQATLGVNTINTKAFHQKQT